MKIKTFSNHTILFSTHDRCCTRWPQHKDTLTLIAKNLTEDYARGVAQSLYPIYSNGKAYLFKQLPWRAAGDSCLASSRSRVRAPALFFSVLPPFLLEEIVVVVVFFFFFAPSPPPRESVRVNEKNALWEDTYIISGLHRYNVTVYFTLYTFFTPKLTGVEKLCILSQI